MSSAHASSAPLAVRPCDPLYPLVTWNDVELRTVPPPFETVIGPVTAPSGTVARSSVYET
jgi:hypothetical protein